MYQNLANLEANLASLVKSFPELRELVTTLNRNGVRYGLYSGSFVALASGYRKTQDLDIIIADRDSMKLKLLFPDIKLEAKDYCNFYYLGNEKQIEIISHSDITVAGHTYEFRLTKLAWGNTHKIFSDDFSLNLLNPVDTILIKSFLQRDESLGKHDLQDIAALLNSAEINKNYLLKRLQEINPNERVLNVLKQHNLLFKQY